MPRTESVRARPADLRVYRERLLSLGSASESRIGARFDRLCARHGVEGAVRIVKRRAGRGIEITMVADLDVARAQTLAGPGVKVVSDAREVIANPQHDRTKAFLAKVL